MAVIDDDMAAIAADVSAKTSVKESVVELLHSIGGLFAGGIAAARAQGSSPAQLQGLTDSHAAVVAHADTLAASVEENTAPPARAAAPAA